MIVSIVGIIFGLLETILSFIQNSHILGLVTGVILVVTSVSLMVIVLIGKKNDTISNMKVVCLILSITVIFLTILWMMFSIIKIVNFIKSPDMGTLLKERAYEDDKFTQYLVEDPNNLDSFDYLFENSSENDFPDLVNCL